MHVSINQVFYKIKPIIPRKTQIAARRLISRAKRPFVKHIWPIYEPAGKIPADWPGWPDGKKFGVVLTHDVETDFGLQKCLPLMQLEKSLGFRSSFNIVPERYGESGYVREVLEENGFEVGVHGLNHDGRLFKSPEVFHNRSNRINKYIKQWGVVGFRAPAMHHDLDLIKKLNVEYDMSTFDIDPFEPQSDGVNTIFPFIVPRTSIDDGYVEMPYTLPQDHGLFIIQMETTNNIWKRKLDWIAERGGMALLNVHPDYVHMYKSEPGIEEFDVELYSDFLNYIKTQYAGQYWHGLPRELAAYLKQKLRQKVV